MALTIEQQIEAIAPTIRQAFIEAKRRILRKPNYKINARHDKMEFFRAAAKVVIELQADPYEFVDACFTEFRLRGGPFANTLAGPSAAAAWKKRMSGSRREIPPARKLPDPDAPKVSGAVLTEAQFDAMTTEELEAYYARQAREAPAAVVDNDGSGNIARGTADEELEAEIQTVLEIIYRNTGSTDTNSPGALAILRDDFFRLPPVAAIIVGAHDVMCLRTHRSKALAEIEAYPPYLFAARKKYPIDDILNWLREDV